MPYGKQFIDEEDIQNVTNILESEFITQGPKIEEFEKKIAEYCGSKFAVTFNSGTSALHGAYFAFGLEKNDELITSPNTFAATSNAALYLNATPVFADVEEKTGNLDISKVKQKITSKTKLIVPVHYAGNPVNIKELYEIAQDHNIGIIEDAAHALGARYRGEKIGNSKYSEMSIFSFHPVKHITTGEGGAVLTNNRDYYEKLIMFRSHGITKDQFINESDGDWYYEMQYLGHNYRITDIQAALGLSQLNKIEMFIKKRRKIASEYNTSFDNNPYFDTICETPHSESAYHLYPILLKDQYKSRKKEIFNKLREKDIGVQVHYIPVYLHPYYEKLGYKRGICPLAEDFYKKEISIPMYPALSPEDQEEVISRIFSIFKKL
ncbi:MAG: UDP-4-amino-4,6-dideoxy-L-N-acetyl-beta-L-altrosamine transaminase [Methanobacterium sp.]|uniref:UDP-4-amino-4, 6-dideoxy-N-acetyl-beta-L-altrosamine transaminase n=1 Tax=Methanobacterium sp. TaxID=2164 RepID=UPI0024AB8E44|nr:UDP-4-amino-4,6-dideoxy-N-acetyl-beta-L-altrosamine transaminase [Methanobacterium sp.]MDI3549605.1 UDP-4-amino-4,6-dideoxy-L-N-acetyl-beta-L-altrosamine transaminase [Methanobacterium sp.]